MEEIKSKVVGMNTQKAVSEEPQKMSYEQLNNVAMQLSQQLDNARKQLMAMNMTNVFKRLDYLFKVVELSEKFSVDFVIASTEEIESLLSTQEEEIKEEDELQA